MQNITITATHVHKIQISNSSELFYIILTGKKH